MIVLCDNIWKTSKVFLLWFFQNNQAFAFQNMFCRLLLMQDTYLLLHLVKFFNTCFKMCCPELSLFFLYLMLYFYYFGLKLHWLFKGSYYWFLLNLRVTYWTFHIFYQQIIKCFSLVFYIYTNYFWSFVELHIFWPYIRNFQILLKSNSVFSNR